MGWRFWKRREPWWTEKARWVEGLPEWESIATTRCPACEYPAFSYTLEQTYDTWVTEYPVTCEFPPWAQAMRRTCKRCRDVSWTKPLNWEPNPGTLPAKRSARFWEPWWAGEARWVSTLQDIGYLQSCPACEHDELSYELIQTDTRWGLSLPITRDLPPEAWYTQWVCGYCNCFGYGQPVNRHMTSDAAAGRSAVIRSRALPASCRIE